MSDFSRPEVCSMVANKQRKGPRTATDVRSPQRRRELGKVRVSTWISAETAECIATLAIAWGIARTQVIERCIKNCCEAEEAKEAGHGEV